LIEVLWGKNKTTDMASVHRTVVPVYCPAFNGIQFAGPIWMARLS